MIRGAWLCANAEHENETVAGNEKKILKHVCPQLAEQNFYSLPIFGQIKTECGCSALPHIK